MFAISLLGGIGIGVYWGTYKSTNVNTDAIALVDYKSLFAYIAAAFPLLTLVIARWGHHMSNPLLMLEADVNQLSTAGMLIDKKAEEARLQVMPHSYMNGEITVRVAGKHKL